MLESKHQLNSYKSQKNLSKVKHKKSPSREYLKMKQRIQKQMRSHADKLFKPSNYASSNRKRYFQKSSSKVSPNTSVRHLRSTSPSFQANNPMDLYRKKRLEMTRKHRKQSSNPSSSERRKLGTKEFTHEADKTNIPRPSAHPTKFKPSTEIPYPPSVPSEHPPSAPEVSLKKLNQCAKYRSPKLRGLASGRKLPYEEALEYSTVSHPTYLSPHQFLKKSRGRKNSVG